MNNLVEFLQDIHNQGWQLWSENGQLGYDAPKEKSTDSILGTLKQHKTEILQLLPQIKFQETDNGQPVVFPLSEAQKQFWFLDQLEENSKQAYVDQVCLELEGLFDFKAMEQAIQKVVERHEALRTRICSEGDFQEVLPGLKIQVPLIDFSSSLGGDRASQVARWLEEEILKPFNLNRAPLFRVYILKLEEQRHQLLLRIHHIINDGLSTEIFLKELSAFYSAQCDGQIFQLEPPLQFREYVEWQNQMEKTAEMLASKSYWLDKFSHSIPVLNLPTDRPRPSIMTYSGSRQTLVLEGDLFERLKKVSRQKGCTLFMMLLASYQILLSKLTGDEEIVIGTPARGRALEGSQNLIGYCNNLLPIRSRIDDSVTVSEILIETRSRLLEDYQHQDYPFPKLLTQLHLERDPSRPVLVSTLFNLDRLRTLPTMSGLKTKFMSPPKKFVPYDIILDITETEKELFFRLDYNLDLFDDATIKRWLNHFQTLLEAMITNPEQQVAHLPLLTAAEQRQLLEISQNPNNNNCIPLSWYDNVSTYILDSHKQLVPLGVEGELYIAASEQPLNGCELYKHPQLGLLWKTQQWGRRLGDGSLEWRGHIHRLVRVKGNRINLQEIEAALRSHPDVKDCHILLRDRQLVAYLEASKALSTESIHTWVKSRLPNHQQPDAYVQVSALPLTTSGKIDENALATLEVIDSQLIERWEEKLHSHPQIERAAVVVQPKQAKTPSPVHILDLIPEATPAVEFSATTTKAPSEIEVASQPKKQATVVPALSDGGQLKIPEGAPKTLAETLQRAAEQHSERGLIYLNSDGSQCTQSYADLLTNAQKILAGLRKIGLKPQDKVIFQLQQNQDFISAFWGCVLGGFIPVPIAIAPSYEEVNNVVSKLYHTWQLLEQPLVLTDARLVSKINSVSGFLNSDPFQVITIDELRKCEPDHNLYISQPDDLALIMLTSGSTGMSKGVMLNHKNLLSRTIGSIQMNGFSTEEITLNWMSLDHVAGLIYFHLRDVYLGCQQIHASTQLVIEKPLRWLDWIDRFGITITFAPNFAFGLVNHCLQSLEQGNWDLSSIRFILNGAEQIVAATSRRFLEVLSAYGLASTAIYPAWGMAEISSGITYSDNFSLDSTTDDDSFVEVGLPIPGVALRIVDRENHIVSEETIGSLQVKGLTVSSGYYQNSMANQESFTEDGWFKTGDLGFLKAGRLTITGRQKDVIIINGLNYYSHEIEAVVEELSGIEVSYTAACAIKDDRAQTDKLAIFFSTEKTADNELIGLLKEIRSVVIKSIGINPDYLIPVDKETIPKTAIGKIQRTQLKQRFEVSEFKSIQKRVDILQENDHTIPRWFYRQKWQEKEIEIGKYSRENSLTLVFVDDLGLGNSLCDRLRNNHQAFVRVEVSSEFRKIGENQFAIAPNNPQHYQQLLESIAVTKTPIGKIVHLLQYRDDAEEIANLESIEQSNARGIYSLLLLIQGLEKIQGSQHQVQLLSVSSYSQFVEPTDKIACEKATVLGLLKTLPQELSWLSCRHLDLPVADAEVNGRYIWQELCDLSPEVEIAYRDGKRFVSGLEAVNMASAPQQELPFKHGGIYLLTGGLGGIGREIAKYLLEHYQARLILVGRTPLSEATTETGADVSDKNQAYKQLQKLGTVIYEAVDICDLDKLQQLVGKAVSEWGGKLDGAIHLAGILYEQMLLAETQETVATALHPKVMGTWVLHQLLKDNEEGLFVHFASVNGFFGGMSVGAYAAANSFQMAFCDYQNNRSNLRSYCLAWSMWDRTGMSRGYQMKELSRAKGYHDISPLQGMYSLLTALCHDEHHLLIGLDSSKALIQASSRNCENLQQLTGYLTAKTSNVQRPKWLVRDRFGSPSDCQWVQLEQMPQTETGQIDRDQLMGSTASQQTQPRNETEHQLVAIFQDVLGVSTVGIHDNFFELRGDSLKMTQVVSRVRELLNLELPLSLLFESPTVAQLSDRLKTLDHQNLSLANQLQTTANNQEKREEIEV